MDEIIPVILSVALGVIIWRNTRGAARTYLSVAAVTVCGVLATVLSGEYLKSWLYVLLDLGEAAFGLIAGFVAAHLLLPAVGRARARSSEKQ